MMESEAISQLRAMLPAELRLKLERELKSIRDAVYDAIRDAVPEYAPSAESPYARMVRSAIDQGVSGVIHQVTGGVPPSPEEDSLFFRIGKIEAREGRQLDTLLSAYRAAGISAWQALVDTITGHDLDPALLVTLSEVVFGRLQELIALSEAGYLQEQKSAAIRPAESRRQLLRLLAGGGAEPERLDRLAAEAGWVVPAMLTPVALRPGRPVALSLLSEDVLVDLTADQPCLILPGRLGPERLEQLQSALGEGAGAIGPAVAPAQVADSLRWARQALRLAERGVIRADGPLIHCDQHLIPLLLHVDEPLVRLILQESMHDILQLTPTKQRQSVETLLAYLRTQGQATAMAKELTLHPQTIRYRMKRLEDRFGDQLENPQARLVLEMALRVLWLWSKAESE